MTGSWSCSSPAVKGVVVGDPRAKNTEMGPLVSKPHWTPWRPTCPTTRPSRSAATRRRARLLVPADRADPARTDRTVTEEIFGRW
jgi:betaine-aldehyde dehydrogenase